MTKRTVSQTICWNARHLVTRSEMVDGTAPCMPHSQGCEREAKMKENDFRPSLRHYATSRLLTPNRGT